jgi:hypothetical protein
MLSIRIDGNTIFCINLFDPGFDCSTITFIQFMMDHRKAIAVFKFSKQLPGLIPRSIVDENYFPVSL